MKTMYPPGYHDNGFVETHALGHMMYGCAQTYFTCTFYANFYLFAVSLLKIKAHTLELSSPWLSEVCYTKLLFISNAQ